MEHKLLARIGAIIFLAIAITMTAIEMSRTPEPIREEHSALVDESPIDPLLIELRRCQALGQAGANDPDCLAAWDESRRRFLGDSARSMAHIADTSAEEN